MNELEKIKAKIAVGEFGGAVVLSVIETNKLFTNDCEQFGDHCDELFYGGTCLPNEGGVYLFEGSTNKHFPNKWFHEGTFTLIDEADEWISVKDKMPTEEFKYYLCYRPSAPMDASRVQMLKQGKFDGIYEVTHWMELAGTPKGKNNAT